MKGVVLSLAPEAQLVDITHGVPPQDVAAGAVALAQAAPLFPPGTIHVAVVDPGVGGARADIVVESGGSFFVGPDNGVLSLAARAPRRVYRIEAAAVPARAGQPDLPRPRRLRADRGAAGGRAPPPRTPARSSTRWSSSARRRCTSRAASSKGEVIHVDALRQPHHVAAGRAVRGRASAPRSQVEVEGGGRAVPPGRSGGRSPTWSRAR